MHRRSFDPARKCRRWSAPPGGGASPPAIALRIPCSVRSGGQLLQGSEAPAPGLMHRRSFDPAGSAVAGVLRPVAGRRPRPLRCAFHAPCGLGDSWLQGSGGSCTGRSFEPARKYRPWSRNPAAIPGRRVAQKGRPGHRRTLARPASPARRRRSRPSPGRPVRPASGARGPRSSGQSGPLRGRSWPSLERPVRADGSCRTGAFRRAPLTHGRRSGQKGRPGHGRPALLLCPLIWI